MRMTLVHLSDIHFSEKTNPIVERLDQIVSGVLSAEPSAKLYLIIISGDVANTGAVNEYAIARDFCRRLKERILQEQPNARIEFLTVPGNHDCTIPNEQMGVREALIAGFVSSLEKGGGILASCKPF